MFICIGFCLFFIVMYISLDPSVLNGFISKPHKKYNGEKSQEKLPSNFSLIRKYIKKIYNNEFEVYQQDWSSSHCYLEFYKIPIKNTKFYIQLRLEYTYSLSTVSGSNKLASEHMLKEMNVYLVTENTNITQELFSIKFLTEDCKSTVHYVRKQYRFITHMEKRRKEVEEEIKLKAEKEAEDKRKEQENEIRKVL